MKFKYTLLFALAISIMLITFDVTYSETGNKPPWNRSLAYDGGGYWHVRVPVTVKNLKSNPLKGKQVRIVLSENDPTSALIGKSVSSLRVAGKNKIEFLFELKDHNEKRKREGILSAGDIVIFPTEAEVDSIAKIFFYAGNPKAWLPPDIRDFTDNPEYAERAVNEWLEIRETEPQDNEGVEVQLNSAEFMELSNEQTDFSWIPGIKWEYRIPITIRNFSVRHIPAGVITINTRHVKNRLGKLFGFKTTPALCLIDPQNPEIPMDISGHLCENIRFIVNVNGETEKTLWLYISNNPEMENQSKMVEMFSGSHNHPDLDGFAGEVETRETQSWPIKAWTINSLVKVFRQDVIPENPVNDIKVYAARNSWKSFQIAIRCLENMDASISVSTLKNIHGEELPQPKIYKTGFIPVDFPVRYYRTPKISEYTRFYPDRQGSDGWRDWWPDPLIPIKDKASCKLHAFNTQPIWFDLHIPKDTSPGVYQGHVIIESETGKIYMPLDIKVWNLILPEKREITAIYDLRTGPGKSPFRGNMPDEKSWSRYLAEYNISPGMSAEPEFTYKNGIVTMTTEKFDEIAHFIFEELNIAMMYTPGFFYSVGWYSGAKPIFDLQPYSPEYIKAWKDAYGMFIDHITKKGWRKNFVLYLSDEPRIPLAYNAIARVADMAKEVAPDVPIYVSSWDYVEEIAGHITAWGIGAQGQFPVELIEKRKKEGDRFIYTTDGQQCMDTPFPATERLMPWFCFKYGVEAFEFWGSTWWTFNPWKYGWHAFVKEGGGEQVKNPVRYPNGDGYLVYPGDEIGIPGPIPSIRLIAVREGVDDFEIFQALDEFAKQGNQDAQEALDFVRSLVIKPHTGGMLSTSFMPDPNAVSHSRILAGETLDRLIND
jgi:hypothetical protein